MKKPLLDYLKSLPSDEARNSFAANCGATLGHIRNVAYGTRPGNAQLSTAIELASDGDVRRWDIRPEDWHRIWPELIGAPGAPRLPKAPKKTTARAAA